MTCHNCRVEMVKAVFYGKLKIQRYKCQQCGRRLSESQKKPFGADVRIPREKVTMILHLLAEGSSMRSVARVCGVDKRTVLTMLNLAGDAYERFMPEHIRNVTVKNLEPDECWTYVRIKEAHIDEDEINNPKIGSQFVYVALCRDTKLVVAWHVGRRDRGNTEEFVEKIRHATSAREFDISTDAWGAYPFAIDLILRDRANHTQVLKIFEGENSEDRYAPGRFITVEKTPVLGNPDVGTAGTSRVERFNGSIRLWIRRMGRLTYAFSKKFEHLRAALALSFCFYNYCCVSEDVPKNGQKRLTPAQEAGLSDHVSTMEELVSTL